MDEEQQVDKELEENFKQRAEKFEKSLFFSEMVHYLSRLRIVFLFAGLLLVGYLVNHFYIKPNTVSVANNSDVVALPVCQEVFEDLEVTFLPFVCRVEGLPNPNDVILLMDRYGNFSFVSGNANDFWDWDGDFSVVTEENELFGMDSTASEAYWNRYDDNALFIDTGHYETMNPGTIEFLDVTFDGYPDIVLVTEAGPYQWLYTIFPFDIETGKYVDATLLYDLGEWWVDEETKRLYSHRKTRGIGDTYIRTEYQFTEGEYVLDIFEEQYLADFEQDREGGYIREVWKPNGDEFEIFSSVFLEQCEVDPLPSECFDN